MYHISPEWTKRKFAITKLSKYSDEKTIDTLISATYDSHTSVVIEALKALRRNKPQKALERVIELAEKSDDANIRWHAIRTLGYYRDATAAVIFAKGLHSDDWLIREESIKGLLKINDTTIRFISIPYILQALDDPSLNVKIAAMKYLNVYDYRIYAQLSKLLVESKEHQHTLLIHLLKALKGYELDSITKEKIINCLTHQNQDIRLAAYEVLITHQKIAKRHKSTTTQ
ncbi:MAG: HEAT repeat domain-containing protein [Spirochaetes bacterium]|nr:HEAT repeat domain-containing protein [Spirochaetota bacterium]